jgi:hypothetical protein
LPKIKGYIKGKTIILLENLPAHLKDGSQVEIELKSIGKKPYPFPTFPLGIKEEYLIREKIYESD